MSWIVLDRVLVSASTVGSSLSKSKSPPAAAHVAVVLTHAGGVVTPRDAVADPPGRRPRFRNCTQAPVSAPSLHVVRVAVAGAGIVALCTVSTLAEGRNTSTACRPKPLSTDSSVTFTETVDDVPPGIGFPTTTAKFPGADDPSGGSPNAEPASASTRAATATTASEEKTIRRLALDIEAFLPKSATAEHSARRRRYTIVTRICTTPRSYLRELPHDPYRIVTGQSHDSAPVRRNLASSIPRRPIQRAAGEC